jgi:hypothetical protein
MDRLFWGICLKNPSKHTTTFSKIDLSQTACQASGVGPTEAGQAIFLDRYQLTNSKNNILLMIYLNKGYFKYSQSQVIQTWIVFETKNQTQTRSPAL